ncbi:MAG: extracellular solute-binding protein, partial [Candidatus Sericytochromatia bacterium]|nr:extracellular solute-binding protein [Candidatus Tanganyikabacteria bacterium]
MALRATRRRILGLMAAGLGATTLAACGEAQVVTKEVPVEKTVVKEVPVEKVVTQVVEKTVTKEVPVEKVVTKEVEKVVTQIVEKVVTAPPQAPVNFIRYVSNHTAGPRGNAMKWALERFAQSRPEIKVRFEPAGALRDILPAQFAAGIAPDATLFTQAWFIEFLPQGAFAEISGAIAKLKDFNKADYYFLPDAYTDNKIDHSFPAPQLMNGPQYGMPFQAAISGFVANVTLAEKAGVTLPSKELSWTWNDWTEWDKKMTNPDAKTFGTQIANSPDFGWWPQMYSNGLKKPFNDALTKSMYDQPEAIEAFKYWVDKIFVQKVAPPIELHKELAAEFGSPF